MALNDNDSNQELSRMEDAHQALQFVDSQPSSNHAPSLDPVIVAAQLSGTFLQGPPTAQGRDGHILCYRRNLFHVRGTIIPKQSFSNSQYVQIRATLTSTESIKGDDVSLITVPKTKRDDTYSPPPSDIKVNLRGDSTGPTSFSWPRLQFRSATAKGGRRKEKGPEQHFILRICIFALSRDGSEVLLSEKLSTPIVVRGRSPSNFPTVMKASGDNRKQSNAVPPLSSSNVDEGTLLSALPLGYSETETVTSTLKLTRDDLAYTNDGLFFDIGTLGSGNNSRDIESSEFLNEDFYFPEDLITLSPNLNLDGPEFLNLALPDRFPHDCEDSTELSQPPVSHVATEHHGQEIRADGQRVQPSLETTKKSFSYKYVPLDLNDRAPPVQAVYQPHGVHHKVTLPKTMQGNNKRYFGEFSD
ncbi:hypothetical protein GGI35DRAFT_474137 [Trichoderma velutinum]